MLQEPAKWAAHAKPVRSAVITGSVTGPAGQPIAGACVTAIGRAGSVLAAAAPDGTFRLAGLAPGSYALEYRDCAAPGQYLSRWSGGAASQRSAARIQATAGQARRVPVMMLTPVSPATLLPSRASWQRMLAAADGRGLSVAAAAKTGRISGVVTGKGKPLGGICVTAFPVNGGLGYGATTTKHGTYTLRHVAAGRYFVTFAGGLCPSNTNWLQQIYRDDNNPFGIGGTVVKVSSGKATTGIDGRLRLGGEISGTVTSKSGHKLAGICVAANGQVTGGFVGIELPTARDGSYHLHALFPGKYSLQFSIGCGSKGNYAPASHRAIRIRYGQDVSGINAALGTGGTITGKVTLTSSSGQPLAGICVFANDNSGLVNSAAATGPAGHYQLIGLSTGTYQLEFLPGCDNDGNYVTAFATAHATAGKVTSGVNAVLQVGGVISGTVTDTHGRPVPGICIDLQGSGDFTANLPDSTADNGSYLINQLSAGTYQIGFSGGCGNSGSYAPNWYNNQSDQSLATPITLAVAGTFTANAQLQPGATITGKVTNASGHRLSGICVYAATETQAEIGPIFQAITETRNGTYSIPNLEPGQYLINFGCGQSASYGDQWFGELLDGGAPALVSAGPGRTTGISAVLHPGGTIMGVVTSTSGHPLAGICVSAANTRQAGTVVSQVGGFGQPVTDAHGKYRLAGLEAGSYYVSFSPCQGSSKYAAQVYRGYPTSAGAPTPVKVKAGRGTTGIDARLIVGGTISGRVVNAAGKPLRNICVFALGVQSGFSSGFAVTGKTGTYTLAPGLPTGNYAIEFTPCGNRNLITVLASAHVTAPHATTGVDATLRAGGSIAGVVTAKSPSGQPVADACVEVVSSNPANAGGFGFTGPDGSYLATGLAAGTYQVFFGDPLCSLSAAGLAPQWYNNQPTQATATQVTVTVGQTTPSIDAALQPDGEITGTVSGPSGSAISGACAIAMPIPGAGVPPVVAVSRPGGYALADLLPGRYKVEFSSGCGAVGYASQWWNGASSKATAKVIRVVAGQDVSGISARLRR